MTTSESFGADVQKLIRLTADVAQKRAVFGPHDGALQEWRDQVVQAVEAKEVRTAFDQAWKKSREDELSYRPAHENPTTSADLLGAEVKALVVLLSRSVDSGNEQRQACAMEEDGRCGARLPPKPS